MKKIALLVLLVACLCLAAAFTVARAKSATKKPVISAPSAPKKAGPFNCITTFAGMSGDCIVYKRTCYTVGEDYPVVVGECFIHICTTGDWDDCW